MPYHRRASGQSITTRPREIGPPSLKCDRQFYRHKQRSCFSSPAQILSPRPSLSKWFRTIGIEQGSRLEEAGAAIGHPGWGLPQGATRNVTSSDWQTKRRTWTAECGKVTTVSRGRQQGDLSVTAAGAVIASTKISKPDKPLPSAIEVFFLLKSINWCDRDRRAWRLTSRKAANKKGTFLENWSWPTCGEVLRIKISMSIRKEFVFFRSDKFDLTRKFSCPYVDITGTWTGRTWG